VGVCSQTIRHQKPEPPLKSTPFDELESMASHRQFAPLVQYLSGGWERESASARVSGS
jgi:hypothetical protein